MAQHFSRNPDTSTPGMYCTLILELGDFVSTHTPGTTYPHTDRRSAGTHRPVAPDRASAEHARTPPHRRTRSGIGIRLPRSCRTAQADSHATTVWPALSAYPDR